MLTTIAVARAKPKDRSYKLADSLGLHLLVQPSGGKYWRLKYRHNGKEKALALGTSANVTLAEAREKRDAARKLLANGIDPNADRKRAKLDAAIANATTFAAVAREWHANQSNDWSRNHAATVWRRIARGALPDIGARPIAELEAPEILACVRKVEQRGALEQSRRLLQFCGSVFRYAVATGCARRDPTADLRGALKKAPPVRHLKALREDELPEFFGKLATYDGHQQTALAIRLLMLTAVRTSELIGARWAEFDMAKAEWRVPAERMKMKREHLVPLSHQAMALLAQLRALNGDAELLFPQAHKPKLPMSNNTILYALYRMGYHSRATGHGMRSLFSTVLHSQGFNSDWIERQLAHIDGNAVRAAYNHHDYLPERTRMMQHWADHLAKAEGRLQKN